MESKTVMKYMFLILFIMALSFRIKYKTKPSGKKRLTKESEFATKAFGKHLVLDNQKNCEDQPLRSAKQDWSPYASLWYFYFLGNSLALIVFINRLTKSDDLVPFLANLIVVHLLLSVAKYQFYIFAVFKHQWNVDNTVFGTHEFGRDYLGAASLFSILAIVMTLCKNFERWIMQSNSN